MKSKQGNDFLDWAYDQRQSEKRKNRIGFIVAGIASFIAIAALLVIAALLPLKEKIPVVITVNEGFVSCHFGHHYEPIDLALPHLLHYICEKRFTSI